MRISVSNLHSTSLKHTHTHTRPIYANELLPPALCFRFPAENVQSSAPVARPHILCRDPASQAIQYTQASQANTFPGALSWTRFLSLTFASLSLLFNFICFGRRRVYATHCNIEKFLCCHLVLLPLLSFVYSP